ncbi:hypothetical protein Ancab_028085, partial [Ancistrocladus abbreviatus]
IEIRINLIGTIDGEVNAGMVVQNGEGDPKGVACSNVRFEEIADAGDGKGGNGAGTESEDHAGFDGIDGFLSGKFLEVVLGELRSRGGSGHGFDNRHRGIAQVNGFRGTEHEVGSGGGGGDGGILMEEGGGRRGQKREG